MFAIMMVVELEATKSVRQPWTWKSADALNGVGRQERGCRGHLLRSSHLALSFSLRTTYEEIDLATVCPSFQMGTPRPRKEERCDPSHQGRSEARGKEAWHPPQWDALIPACLNP